MEEPGQHRETGPTGALGSAGPQEFAAIAGHCSAAQVLSLKPIRETCYADELGRSWDEFCQSYIGLTRL
ncbi:MAG: hypothetical protein ACLQU1_25620 [Bryobacteraceae bacterium]